MKKTILLGCVLISVASILPLFGQNPIPADTLTMDSVTALLSMSALAASADYSIDLRESPYQRPEA